MVGWAPYNQLCRHVQLSFWGDAGDVFFLGGWGLWKRSVVFPEVPADLFCCGGWLVWSLGQFGISGGKPPSFRWYFVDQHSVAYGESQHFMWLKCSFFEDCHVTWQFRIEWPQPFPFRGCGSGVIAGTFSTPFSSLPQAWTHLCHVGAGETCVFTSTLLGTGAVPGVMQEDASLRAFLGQRWLNA